MTNFKNASVIAIAVIAAIIIVSLYTAYTCLQNFCDQLVAVSLLEFNEPIPAMSATVLRMPLIAKRTLSTIVEEVKLNYAAMTVKELKKLCKGTGIKGWSKLCKSDLVIALAGF